MSIRDQLENHPIYWLALAFSAGIGFVAMLAAIFGLEPVRRGSFVLRDDLTTQYIRRDSIQHEYVPKASLISYMPIGDVNANYVARSNIDSTYISRALLATHYVSKDDVLRDYVPRREMDTLYIRREAIERDYVTREMLAMDYLSKHAVATDFIRKSECATGRTASASEGGTQRVLRFQDFPQFRVEVARLQAPGNGAATAILRYTNKTSETLKLVLCGGFCGDNKTFLLNADGEEYYLSRASGISECCFGFAGGDPRGGILELPPGGQATATLTFAARRSGRVVSKNADSVFSLSSEQMLGDMVETRQWGTQWRKTHTVSIAIQDVIP